MTSNRSSSPGGVGFVGLLTIVFITLKLTKVITWSWWWVWSPFWITALFAITCFGLYFVTLVIEARWKSKR